MQRNNINLLTVSFFTKNFKYLIRAYGKYFCYFHSMKEPTCYIPFFNIRSKLLKDILGVKDMRSVKAQLNAIGVRIRWKGKHGYIISEERIQALGDKRTSTRYHSSDPKNAVFYE